MSCKLGRNWMKEERMGMKFKMWLLKTAESKAMKVKALL